MSTDPFIQTLALAMNASGQDVPSWIQLTPSGPDIQGRDGRTWSLLDPESVVAAFNRHEGDLPIDFEHATQVKGNKGEAAPAVGWIKEIEVRNRALWGRVEWNDTGRKAISAKEYRYVSPVFAFKRSTGEMTVMRSAGLTNLPNLKLEALNRGGATPEIEKMDKAVLKALGLEPDATAVEAVVAINKLKTDQDEALNKASHPDPELFVPKADHDLALNKVRDFEGANKKRQEAAIDDAVDAAVAAGKVAPSSREYHLASCRADGGLARFQTMVAAAPEIAGKSGLDNKDPKLGQNNKLSEEELAMCKALDMSEADFAAAKETQE